MRAGGSPRKGGDFERDTCRRLSLWVTVGRRDDVFWRSATSGARATVQLGKGIINLAQSGDMSAIDPEGYEFVRTTFVEMKHRKDLGIGRGLVCGTGDLANFWRTACVEASKYDKRPLLIARQNLYPTLAITRLSDDVFDVPPMMVLLDRGARVYLFEDATRVARPPLRRRA